MKLSPLRVCPTYVGMNRIRAIKGYCVMLYAPRMWG